MTVCVSRSLKTHVLETIMKRKKSIFKTLIKTLTTDKTMDAVTRILIPQYGIANRNISKKAEFWVEGIKHSKRCLYLVGVKDSNYKYPFFIVRLNLIDEVKRLMNDKNFIKYEYTVN